MTQRGPPSPGRKGASSFPCGCCDPPWPVSGSHASRPGPSAYAPPPELLGAADEAQERRGAAMSGQEKSQQAKRNKATQQYEQAGPPQRASWPNTEAKGSPGCSRPPGGWAPPKRGGSPQPPRPEGQPTSTEQDHAVPCTPIDPAHAGPMGGTRRPMISITMRILLSPWARSCST